MPGGAVRVLQVPGMGALPLNPTRRQQEAILKHGHSYTASIDLTAAGIGSNNGVLQPYAGFGLYLMHRSPANTIFEVRFDQNFGQWVEFRRGAFHLVGHVNPERSVTYFNQFWAKVVQSGDTTGTAYFLVLGSPDAWYYEDPRQVPYQPSATTTTVATTSTTILASIQIQTVRNLRLTVNNTTATAFATGLIQISPDGTTWETILGGTIDTLAGNTMISVNIPAGPRYLRVTATVAAGTTSATVWLTGTMG